MTWLLKPGWRDLAITNQTTDESALVISYMVLRKAVGYTILASIALIVLLAIFPHSALIKKLDPVFWLESLAVVAFGVSWLTKGEMILKDES